MKTMLFASVLLVAPWFPAKAQGVHQGERRNETPAMTVTIVFDNDLAVEDLHSGWGFAALLETGDYTVLFDTGNEGRTLLENLEALGKDPSSIDAVVLSHAHWDHTGGLEDLLGTGVRPDVFVLSAFADEIRTSIPEDVSLIEVEPGQQIAPGIRTTGQVGSEIPEQAVFFETDKGTVVLTGCAHAGPLAMAEPARAMGSGALRSVLGGYHLMQATPGEIEGILARFQELGIEEAGPTHCSGEHTEAAFREAFGPAFIELGSGRILRF